MLVSAFTPTHNAKWLPELYKCMLEQTHKNWEWVIVPNGIDAVLVAEQANALAQDDARIRVIPFPQPGTHGIGRLKKFACDNCKGDLLAEVDHDDLLTRDCFAEVVAKAKNASANSFIFSDVVTLNADGTSATFTPEFGWRHYRWTYDGKEYDVNKQFPINPKTISEILFCPDHIRVWTKGAYKLLGGHNTELDVADDHDLMIRTYLLGTEFHYIDRPLYFHRLRVDNTCTVRVNEIQHRSQTFRDAHIYSLVMEWCEREGLPMYDLGGAHNCPDKFLPIDRHLPQGVPGFRGDIFDNLPIEENSVGCFRAYDFLEHIPTLDVVKLMNKLYKLLVPGGWLLTCTPAICDNNGRAGRGAFQDPTHVSFWSSNNWWYFTKKEYSKFVPEIECRFQTATLINHYPSQFHWDHLIPYVVSHVAAIKDDMGYWPGPVHI